MTVVYKKQNALSAIKNILDSESPNSILLIRGNQSYITSGAQDMIEPQLSGFYVKHLCGFQSNPSLEDIQKTVDNIHDEKIDFIVAIGGGTVMDIAKAASILHDEKEPLDEYIKGNQKPQGENITRLLIPTTAGTGAEITPFSVVYIDKIKYSLTHKSMTPEYVILAPELTYHLSPRLTAISGCDALSQAIEGFWSIHATEKSKSYSRQAIPLILKNLSKVVNKPNPENRESMSIGAHLSGQSIAIAKTTGAHALSYPLTAYHNIPHGHAVMLILPYFFLVNEQINENTVQSGLSCSALQHTFKELLSLLNVKEAFEAKEKLTELMKEIHLETQLSKLGVQKNDLQNIFNNAFNPQRIKNNPIRISKEIVWDILQEIY